MRILAAPALVAGLILGLSVAPHGWAEERLSLAAAQQQALADNPRLAQIEARYEAALTRPSQVGALPDPTLNLGIISLPTDTFNLDQEPMTQLQVGINQPIPWFGKLELAEAAAQRDADAAAEELAEARVLLARDVARGWWALFYLDHALAVVDANLDRLREFNRIAQSRYRVGKGLQQDALQAQLELSTQLEQQIRLGGERRQVVAQLNALLGRAGDIPITLQEPPSVTLQPLPDSGQLVERGLTQRPAIRRQQRLVDAAGERRALAERDRYPDLSLGAAYGYRQDAPNGSSRADLLSVTLGIKLPLYADRKQHRAIDQRGAELIAEQQALRESQLAMRAEVEQSIADYQRAREQTELLQQGIIPQARQTVASMLSGYQVGKVDFTALVRAQLQVNRVQLQYWAALRDAQQARARLVAAVGGEIDE
ncbi:TolC family protein [Motiliproteus sediminis]|uniref:TolC family protein n=1 Tax=Motiliproteus sediminis TaxID=1468178 RepID=UPI001AEFB605|nr:TolC family protein [Motiliproteus sediminis]